jgi:hypothetical protein
MPRMKIPRGRRSPMVMYKGEGARELQSRLKWLLDFMNKDIDSLRRTEILKLFIDVVGFMYGRSSFEEIGEMNFEPKPELDQKRKFLKECQEYLRVMVKDLQTAEIKEKESDVRFSNEFHTYQIYYHIAVSKDRVFKFRPLPHPWFDTKMPGELIEDLIEWSDVILNYPIWNLLADALIDTLNPFPLSRIKTCAKCGNYFYQKTTKTKGDFCSPKCKNWARTNRWRKANPDKYNAYHRNRRAKAKEDQAQSQSQRRPG